MRLPGIDVNHAWRMIIWRVDIDCCRRNAYPTTAKSISEMMPTLLRSEGREAFRQPRYPCLLLSSFPLDASDTLNVPEAGADY